jgi:hypothetical protein
VGDVTPNLKLNVPDFDQDPWDQDVNTNWAILDATVGLYTAIPNLTGVWRNTTAYTYGQSTIDPADSSIWSCAQAHTSSDAPTTFQQDRVQYPIRWSATTPGAMFYATQAATSAQAAANSAASAAASAALIGNALPISGGTMTGALILHADPSNVLEATTKQYVDARVGGVGFLPLTGGTLTGTLVVGGTGVAYGVIASSNRHFSAFGWDGQLYATINGTNVGYLATTAYVSGSYLPLGGGNLSGTLYVAGELQAAQILRLNSSGTYLYGAPTAVDLQMDAAGWRLRYVRASGMLQYLNGASTELFHIDGGGNGVFNGAITTGGNAVILANVYASGGSVFVGASNRASYSSDNANYTKLSMLDNYGWQLNWSTGILYWIRYDGASILSIDTSGDLTCSGSIQAGGGLSCHGGDFWFGLGGSGRVINIASGWYWNWDSANGDLFWVSASGGSFIAFSGTAGYKLINQIGPVGGTGAYENYSDIRGKMDIEQSPYGLNDVLKLKPIEFTRISNGKREIGFSAQDVREVIPLAVHEMGLDDKGTLSLSIDPIVAALVNGMQELSTRIIALEGKQ